MITPAHAPSLGGRTGPGARVLVVDDDRPIRDALSSILEVDGYNVELAENGQVALDHIRKNPKPDLMLLDLMMPVLSGFELLEMLEDGDADLGAVPILVISAMSAPMGDPDKRGGVKACLGKPIDMDLLLDAVRTHVRAAVHNGR